MKSLLSVSSLLLLAALAGPAEQAAAQAIDTQNLRLRGARTPGTTLLPSARLLSAGSWEPWLTWQHDGAVIRADVPTGSVRGGDQTERLRWLNQRDMLHLGFALSPAERVELVFGLPILLAQSVEAGETIAAPLYGTSAIGDPRLVVRYAVIAPEGAGLAWTLQGGLSLPGGKDEYLFGERRTRAEIGTTVGYRHEQGWETNLYLGYETGAFHAFGNQIFGDAVNVGASFQMQHGPIRWNAEAVSHLVTTARLPRTAPDRGSLELLGGARYAHDDLFFVDVGVGFGALDAGITPRWRTLLTIGTTGAFGRTGTGGTNRDSDGDGIPDVRDLCPTQAEDLDGFEDEDGCPDWDNDGDGIPDTHDLCPDEPEDFDGIEDHDGCPEEDADRDGIPDALDLCPLAPEDYDGFEDEDGCPEPGVRESGQQWRTQQLEELTVYFDTNKAELDPTARNTLRSVALLLMRNEGRVLVSGHADDRGTDELNEELSLQRAEAARQALVEAGVDASRLEVRVAGPREPISPATEFGRSMNRRVIFEWAH